MVYGEYESGRWCVHRERDGEVVWTETKIVCGERKGGMGGERKREENVCQKKEGVCLGTGTNCVERKRDG